MTAPWTPRERALRGALEATPCRCSKAIKNTCPTCGETLVAATPSPYLNSYQWDAIKAGDWFCNTCEDTSIGNGKKHWHDRELETITYQQCGRCDALAEAEAREAGEKCPRCGSPDPALHPAMQFEGEVQPCGDHWHKGQAREAAKPSLADQLAAAQAEAKQWRDKCRVTQAKLENMAIDCGQAEGLLKRCREEAAQLRQQAEAKRLAEGE